MDKIYLRMLELSSNGFYCSQILMALVLEKEGKENPDLLRAMGGLIGGLGFNGKICGGLTGGICILGYYGSKGIPEEMEDPDLPEMIKTLIEWFENEFKVCQGIECDDILEKNPKNQKERCPDLVRGVYDKTMEILLENGYEV